MSSESRWFSVTKRGCLPDICVGHPSRPTEAPNLPRSATNQSENWDLISLLKLSSAYSYDGSRSDKRQHARQVGAFNSMYKKVGSALLCLFLAFYLHPSDTLMLRSIMSRSTPQNVVVVGGSYVGLGLAETLAKTSSDKFRVLLVEKNSHFQHLFAFPRYALTTKVDTHKAFIPYQKSRLGQAGAIVQAKAISLSKDTITLDREVELDGKRTNTIPYAALAITTGTKLSPPSTLPGSEKLDGTAYLRKHSAQVEASRKIVIIGGGAVGVQMATDIKQLFPEKSVTLIHSREHLMSKFHPGLHSIVSQRFSDLGVETVLGRGRVKLPEQGYPTDGSEFTVEVADGTQVPADFAIISTGQTPQSEILSSLAPECIDESKFIKVRPTLQIADSSFPNIFALGDIAATKAHKAARPAMRQSEVVSENIQRLLDGKGDALEEYAVTDPAAIHLTLGIEKSVIFRNPRKDGSEGSEEPVAMHKDDGRFDMGIDGVWARRGADITQAML